MQTAYDVVVVGGGPAGSSAALWLGRYRRSVLLIDSEEYRNRWVRETHGYLGSDPIDPALLRARVREDVAAYPTITRLVGRVTAASGSEGAFSVELEGGMTHAARALILATGVRDAFPEIKGFFDHYGVSVFHCPTCDGYEAKGRHVVALGWGPWIAGFARHLLQWAASLTVVSNGHDLEADRAECEALRATGVILLEEDADSLVGEPGKLEAVRLVSGEVIPCDMVFFSIGHEPVADLAVSLGCALQEDGLVEVDANGRTSVSGVWAAGDVTPGPQLVQMAAAKGTAAGVCCALSLADLE